MRASLMDLRVGAAVMWRPAPTKANSSPSTLRVVVERVGRTRALVRSESVHMRLLDECVDPVVSRRWVKIAELVPAPPEHTIAAAPASL